MPLASCSSVSEAICTAQQYVSHLCGDATGDAQRLEAQHQSSKEQSWSRTLFTAPLALKDPVTCRFSSFRSTAAGLCRCTPSSAAASQRESSKGVASTPDPARRSDARQTSATSG